MGERDLDLSELERLYRNDKTRPVGTIGQRDVLALIARVREAEARIEKVRGLSRYTVCDPTMTWTAVDAEDLDAVLTEGDGQ